MLLKASALGSFYCGTAWTWLALGAVVWPSQIASLVGNDRKELFNGIVPLPGVFINAIIPPIAGAISDRSTSRFGRRRPMMVIGTLLASIFCAVMAIYSSPFYIGPDKFEIFIWLLMITSILFTFGMSISQGAFTGLMPDVIEPSRHGFASGILGVGRSIGNLAGVLLSGIFFTYIPNPYDLWCAYGLCSFVMLSTMSFVCVVVRETPLKETKRFNIRQFICSFCLPPRPYRNFYFVSFGRFFFEMGIYSLINYLQFFFKDVHRVTTPELTAATLLSFVVAFGVISSIISGYLSDRFDRKVLIIVATIITVSVMLANILSIQLRSSFYVSFAINSFFGIGQGMFYAIDWALIIDVLPYQDSIAKDMAIWQISSTFPTLVAPLITGLILDRTKSLGFNNAYSISFAVSTMWFIISIFFMFFVNSKRKTKINRNHSNDDILPSSDVISSTEVRKISGNPVGIIGENNYGSNLPFNGALDENVSAVQLNDSKITSPNKILLGSEQNHHQQQQFSRNNNSSPDEVETSPLLQSTLKE